MTSPTQGTERTAKRSIYELIADPKATQLLPSLTSIVKELEHLIGQQNVMLEEISRLIRTDQSMAVRVLRLANSAYFAPVQPIIDLDHALIYLGLNQVRSTILTARCIEKICATSQSLLSWRDFWLHEVAVGYIMKVLASTLSAEDTNPESFYVMGLFHDIGKVALAYLSAYDFESTLILAQERHCATSPVEIELLGLDHANLGAWYLQQQGMPPNLVEPIRLHHAWTIDVSHTGYACLLNLADQLAHFSGYNQSGSCGVGASSPFASPEWEKYMTLLNPPVDPELHAAFITEKIDSIRGMIQCLAAT